MTGEASRPSADELYAEALAAWDPGEPEPGFAKRVSACAPRRRGRARTYAMALAAAAAVVLFVLSLPRQEGLIQDQLRADARTTIQLGERGLAVAERGAALHWSAESTGAVTVTQSGGMVLYRVSPGGPFAVQTPLGVVTVTGTVFEVEVKPTMEKATAKGIGIGAALATAIVVTVYEGAVVFANDQGTVEVGAGERTTVAPGEAPTAPADARERAETLQRELAALRAESGHQQRVIEQLRGSAGESSGPDTEMASENAASDDVSGVELVRQCGVGSNRGAGACMQIPRFEASPEQLREMARCGTVVWDQAPEYHPESFEPSPLLAKALELGPDEIGELTRANAEFDRAMNQQLREIYSDLTGNEPEASLTGPALRSAVSAIVQSHAVDPGAGMDLYRQIARERAGLDQAPDPHAIEPGDRLQRLTIASGDLYMQFAAERLGKERARALRQKHQGWPMTGFSSGQCPD